MVSGLMGRNKEMGPFSWLMEMFMRVNGLKERERVWGSISGAMGMSFWESFMMMGFIKGSFIREMERLLR